MNNGLLNKIIVLIFFSVFVKSESICQEFITTPFITIPGNNLEFDVVTPEYYGSHTMETYICWVNTLNSVYTVYLMQVSPALGSAIVVVSDTRIKSMPQIAYSSSAPGITIVWQSLQENLWRVCLRNYAAGQLDETEIILDSLREDPHVSLSTCRIAWIQNGNLFTKYYYPHGDTPILVDSMVCASPQISRWDNVSRTELLYEKIANNQHKISVARFTSYVTPAWEYMLLAGDNARNPQYGIMDGVSYEILKNQISQIQYSVYGTDWFETTTNETCNYKNPCIFSYPLTTGSLSATTPFFVVFDSDSIPGNNEIFMKPIYGGMIGDTIINISQYTGSDVEPRLVFLNSGDSVFIAILWKHIEAEKVDIWMAKAPFNPINNGIREEHENISSFRLMQNYPNPFNPVTTITFRISTMSYITLKIFDVIGREVTTLLDETREPGMYEVTWNAAHMPSGVYLCQMKVGNSTQTKKFVLMK
jgi:hypothetical protein